MAGSTRASRPARALRRSPSPKRELDLAAVDEVQLLLALVAVPAGGVARRQDDRVDAERRHAELAADLAEARARRPCPSMLPTAQPSPVVGLRRPAMCGGILGACRRTRRPARRAAPAAQATPPTGSAVLLDVDGVLAPIVQHPDDAHMPETTRRPLIEVAKRYGVVACVSGRRASDARRIVSLGSIAYLGSHGSEILRPARSRRRWTASCRRGRGGCRTSPARRTRESLRKLRVRLEDKEAIAALHWRGVPDEEEAEAAVREVAEAAEKAGFNAHWGRKVLEIRPPVRIDKGAGIVVAAARPRARGGALRRRRHDGPRRVPRPGRAGRAGLARSARCGSASRSGDEAPSELEEEADVMVDGTDGVRDLLRALLALAPRVRFVDFLKATVLLSAGAATLLAALTVIALARDRRAARWSTWPRAGGWWPR